MRAKLGDNTLAGRARVRLTYIDRILDGSFSAVLENSTDPLVDTLNDLEQTADADALAHYMVSALILLGRALLTETGDYPVQALLDRLHGHKKEDTP